MQHAEQAISKPLLSFLLGKLFIDQTGAGLTKAVETTVTNASQPTFQFYWASRWSSLQQITQHDPLDSTLRKELKLRCFVLIGSFPAQMWRPPAFAHTHLNYRTFAILRGPCCYLLLCLYSTWNIHEFARWSTIYFKRTFHSCELLACELITENLQLYIVYL